MKLSVTALAGCVLLAINFSTLAEQPAKKPSATQAKAAAAKWIEGLGKNGLVLNQTCDEPQKERTVIMSHAPSALGRVTKFSFQQPGWWFDVVCKGEHTADTSAKTLQDHCWYAALHRLPTPGLDLPGWEVRPRTPKSSFNEGVEFLEFADGRLKVRIQTTFFALYGKIERDPSEPILADAPSPPGTYFQIRKEFPLDLTLEAPFSFEK